MIRYLALSSINRTLTEISYLMYNEFSINILNQYI